MIAIFNTEIESVDFSNQIHQLLLNNRNGYIADRWSSVNKSDNDNKWCVPLPEDYDNYTEKLELTDIELITKLPDNWNNTEDI